MTTKLRWKEPVSLAVGIGVVLAAFVALSLLVETGLTIWLWTNNSLVIVSLLLSFLIGYRQKGLDTPLKSVVFVITVFYLIVMAFYVGSYAVMTYFFSDYVSWMPFFHRDYSYHGYRSVREYMNHENNFRDLLILQIVSCLIASVLYLAAGIAGFLSKVVISRSNPT